MEVYTIGFTRQSAAAFFRALRQAGIRRLLDVRLNNTSQLAGFAKGDDLAFFLRELCDAEYVHEPLLAPSAELLEAYRSRQLSWEDYAVAFVDLLAQRDVASVLQPAILAGPTVLLCSEPTAMHCHRRLVVEHLASAWGGITPVHL